MATKLQWPPRLLLLFAFLLAGRTAAAFSGVHPVVLLPGNTCSQIEVHLSEAYEPPSPLCGAHRGDGRWSRLWKNSSADVRCFADQFRLEYDLAAGDYGNAPGVETRPLSFGSTRGFLADDPADRDLCTGRLVEALERAGYRDGETLFGAPYDFRYAPAAPGQVSGEFYRFRRMLRELVELASRKNGGKPVILVSHSQGGYFALEFLNRSPLPWRRRHVKHFVMASTGAGGFVLSMRSLGYNGSTASADVLKLRSLRWSMASVFTPLPSPTVFGDDKPLVVTPARNYTARDMPEFLAAVGAPPLAAWLYETRALPLALSFRAPVVPVTCINGVGVPTIEKLVYPDGNDLAAEDPEVEYGDGDGIVNLASILALDTVIGEDPRQEYYKSIKIANMSHLGIVSDDFALERFVDIVGEEVSNTGDNISDSVAVPNTSSNILINFPTTTPNLMQGGYTSLLLGLDQNGSAVQKLHFDTGANDTTFEE